MILAVLENLSKAEILLNNLSEADFNLDDVSVIHADVKQRDAVAKDVGPLKGTAPEKLTEKLTRLGVPKKDAEICQDAIFKNKVVVVMEIPSELNETAQEMFRDYSAQIIKGDTK